MEQLEFAVRNLRHRGTHRFRVTQRDGRTIVALREHLLEPRHPRSAEGPRSTGAGVAEDNAGGTEESFGFPASDTDATEAPYDGSEFDGAESSAIWESVSSRPTRADGMSPTGSIGPGQFLTRDSAGEHP